MKKRGLALLAFLLGAAVLLGGCHGELPNAALVAQELLERLPLPSPGVLYRLDAEPWEEGYVSPSLWEALFSQEVSLPSEQTRGAFFLGSLGDGPLEFAVFPCLTGEEAVEIAALCLERLTLLRRLAPTSPNLVGAKVQRFGRTVVYTVLPDNAAAIRILRSIL